MTRVFIAADAAVACVSEIGSGCSNVNVQYFFSIC